MKIKHKKYNKHVQREVELYLPELSMMEKVPKQQPVEFWYTPFQNDDTLNDQLENTGNILVALKPSHSLHSVVYPISEAKSSTLFKLLMMCFSLKLPVRSHSLVCGETYLFIVGIGPILDKEL